VKLGSPTRLTRESLPGLPAGEAFDLLLQHINQSNEEKTQALQNNLTFGDNLNAAITDPPLRMTHGVERTIKNPIKGRPVGIKAIRSSAINGGVRYTVREVDWRFVDGTDPSAPQQLGIKAWYAPTTEAEVVESVVSQASAVALVTGTCKTVTSISLTPGSWMVGAMCLHIGTAGFPGTGRYFLSGVSATANTRATDGDTEAQTTSLANPGVIASTLTVPPKKITVTATTTYYLVAQVEFSAGTCSAYGRITAQRTAIDPAAQNDIAFVVYGG
jgi:hypothetical protein